MSKVDIARDALGIINNEETRTIYTFGKMNFKITDTKPLDKNTLRGVFSLVVGPMKIEGWTYHVKEEKSWVNPPSKEYIDKETGDKKYQQIVRFPEKDRYWAFQDWAKDQLKGVFDASTAVPEPGPEQAGLADQDSIPF